MMTEQRYETPLCRLRCDGQGFVLVVGEAEIQGDWARLQRWQRTVTRYVEGFLRTSEPIVAHRVTVDNETYILSTLQLFDLFTTLAQVAGVHPTVTASLPLVGVLGGIGFALGAGLTFGLLPRSPAIEVAQTASPPIPPPEEQVPSPAVTLELPPAKERIGNSQATKRIGKPKPEAAPLPPPTPVRVTRRPSPPPPLEETRDRPVPQSLPLPVAEWPIARESLADRLTEPADPTPRLQAHLQSLWPSHGQATAANLNGVTVLQLTWQPNQPPSVTVESTTLPPGAIAQLQRQIEAWSRQNPSPYQGTTRLRLVPGRGDFGPASGSKTTPVSPPRSSDPPETPPPAPGAN